MSPCGREPVAAPAQVSAQLFEVVDLAVEDDHHRAVLVEDRLIAGHQIDYAQPLDAETDVFLVEHAPRVGAAVLEASTHPLQELAFDRAPTRTSDLTDDPTHGS